MTPETYRPPFGGRRRKHDGRAPDVSLENYPKLVQSCVRMVAAELHCRPADIIQGPQSPLLVAARKQIAVQLAALTTRDGAPVFSTVQIGRFLGGRHHSTVIAYLGGRRYPDKTPATPAPAADDPFAPDYSGEWAI